jgi:sigma-B regulation protein RsbU (phosphoserine phosphatase)
MKEKRTLWSRLGVTAKILIVFLTLSIASLVITGSIALITISGVGDYALESGVSLGNRAVNDSTTALENDAEEYLLRMATDQAAISNTLFERVEAETSIMAQFASTLVNDPSSYTHKPLYAQNETPEDVYARSAYALAPDVDVAAVSEELNVSSCMDDIFIPIYAADPHLTWVYIGTESGILRMYPWYSELDPSFDHRVRGWYIKAKETGDMSWSDPYIDVFGHGLMVTCSKPVYNSNDDLVWVIGADVTIETINQDIINTQIGELGYAILLDDHGCVIARPGLSAGDKKWDESFETENLPLSKNAELRAIAKNMTAGNTGIARCRFEGGEKYIAYAPIRCTNWSVGVVMPVEEIIAPALTTKSKIIAATQDTGEHINQQMSNMKKIFFGIFIALFLGVSGLSFLLSRIITKPVMRLKEGSGAIGKGDLDYKVDVKTGDEFEELANSFNQMAADLKGHIEELQRTTAEKERMSKELEIGKGIQQSFLPESTPEIAGIDLAAFNLPAMEVGGDFYDFIPISKDKWGLAIADVSGKGVPAALFMALSRTLIRASAVRNPTAVNAIKQANRLICEDSKTSMFVTLFYALADSKKMTLTYVNAGHNPPLLFRGASADITLLEAKGIALGVIEEAELEEAEIGLKSGDLVVLYTDGITEAINEEGEEFGQERLMRVVRENRTSTAHDIIEHIREEVVAFAGKQPQFDDITLMVLKAE